jgi:hypothetical protein
VTVNRFGRGRAAYVAAAVEQSLLDKLAAALAGRPAGMPACESPLVEVVPCRTAAGELCFVLNHGAAAARVDVPRRAHELLADRQIERGMELGPYDVAALLFANAGS